MGERNMAKKIILPSASLEPLLNWAKNKTNCFCYSDVKNQILKDQDLSLAAETIESVIDWLPMNYECRNQTFLEGQSLGYKCGHYN